MFFAQFDRQIKLTIIVITLSSKREQLFSDVAALTCVYTYIVTSAAENQIREILLPNKYNVV